MKGNINIHLCEKCRGFFLPLKQQQASQLETLLKKQFSKPLNTSSETGIISPHSGDTMKQFEYRNVLLDYCTESHAIWFDRGEYTKIFASRTPTVKSRIHQSDSKAWDVVDAVTVPMDIIDLSGEVIGAVGEFVGDLISGISL